MNDVIYSKASYFLTNANDAIVSKNNAKAVDLIDQGIIELGDHYLAKDVVDDTSLKLTLGQVKQSQGDLEQAVNLKRSVLISRLEMYKNKISCE